MTKNTDTRSDWGYMLDYCESEIRKGWTTGKHPDMRGYVVALRTMQRMGATRSDDMPTGRVGDMLVEKEMDKSHAEWDQYVRVQEMFSPHVRQYRSVMFPNPQEDFHAAWVKAGEDND